MWLLLAAIPILAVLAFVIVQPIQVLPRIALAPGFSLIDQNGNRLTNEDQRGKITLYTFTYTGCDAPCPQTSATIQEIQSALADMDTGGVPIQYVSISFDPAQDTPERLHAHAEQMDADTDQWHFVTGDPAELKTIIGGGFSAYYQDNGDGTFDFDPAFALVDGWGILRARYKAAFIDTGTIRRDIGLLIKEAQNQDGPSRYAYEAAHLFLCYP